MELPEPKDHGRFLIFDSEGKLIEAVDNTLTDEGREEYLKMMFQASTSVVSAGGNFYLGLCGLSVTDADTLASIAGEPTATNGYARVACTRDATGFPTVSQVNGVWRAQSKPLTFAASGGNFSTSVRRCFLCNAASGSTGKLFGYGGALTSALQINNGQSYSIQYEFYLD
jgi:hypothetical protein